MSTAATKTAWGTARTMAALREKYALPEYAILQEVGNGTGGRKTRSADALAMSCWPSRGLHLIGFEVKVSRSDWLREKENPAKAESICRYCDFWYVVAGSRDIVGPGELPPTWGLLEPKGTKLVVSREAPKLEAVPMGRSFLAALLRRAAEDTGNRSVFEAEKAQAVADAFDRGKVYAQERMKSEAADQIKELENLRAVVARFEEASGLRLDRWSPGARLGLAVKCVLDGGLERHRKGMEAAEAYARDVIEAVRRWREVSADLGEPDAPAQH